MCVRSHTTPYGTDHRLGGVLTPVFVFSLFLPVFLGLFLYRPWVRHFLRSSIFVDIFGFPHAERFLLHLFCFPSFAVEKLIICASGTGFESRIHTFKN